MNRLKKFFSTIAAVVLAGGIAWSANIPLTTGIFEPSQLQSIINALTQNINANSPGLVASFTSNIAVIATTTIYNMFAVSIPANTVTQAGQGVRVRCYGYTAQNTDTKTVTISFGEGPTYTATNTSSSMATNGLSWDLDLLVTWNASASSWNWMSHAFVQGASPTVLASSFNDTLSSGFTSPQTARCAGTQGSATAGDIVGVGFSVETVK
jgi:hypothetical protein